MGRVETDGRAVGGGHVTERLPDSRGYKASLPQAAEGPVGATVHASAAMSYEAGAGAVAGQPRARGAASAGGAASEPSGRGPPAPRSIRNPGTFPSSTTRTEARRTPRPSGARRALDRARGGQRRGEERETRLRPLPVREDLGRDAALQVDDLRRRGDEEGEHRAPLDAAPANRRGAAPSGTS